MRLVVLCIVILSLFTTLAFAASEITSTPIDNDIRANEVASFELYIKNFENVTQRYSIYSLQSVQGWRVDPSPLKDKIIELGPQQEYTTTINAEPQEDFAPGIYNIQISIASDLGEQHTEALKVYLSPENPTEYLPSFKVDVDMVEKITPGEPVSIKLFLENGNPLDLTGMQLKLQSDIPEFRHELTVDLPPLEKKTVEFTVTPDMFQQPKEYTLFFVFKRDDQTIKVVEKDIVVVTVVPDFALDSKDESIYLKTFTELEVKNNGNVRNTQEVRWPTNTLDALFTQGAATKKIDGQRYLVWDLTLGPNESTTVHYVTNYRILVYILVVVGLLLAFYLYARSPLAIRKTAVTTKIDEEGALSGIKVTLEIRNHSKKPIKNVVVTDEVPAIANVEKSLELGTLKPQEIRHTKQGTKVMWSLAELDTQEHRLITYKVKAKLNILGTFQLPRAVLEYSTKKNKKRKAYSNYFRLKS